METLRHNLRAESLTAALRDLQCDVHRLFNEPTEFPSYGLRHTLFRRRNRVIEKASDLLNRSARLLLLVRDHEEHSENGQRRDEWSHLSRRVDELKENWRSLRNEDSYLMMESLNLDLGAGD